MKLQSCTRYALLAMMELTAQPDMPVSASEISARYRLPPSHLAKVLRALGRAGFVEALRGIGGGYRLAHRDKPVSLLDVILLFEPDHLAPHDDMAASPDTPEQAALTNVFHEVITVEQALLASVTFKTLVRLPPMQTYDDRPLPRALQTG